MSATTAATAVDRRAFWLRRLHSLSGLVPVGAFMCVHLFENATAIKGPKSFGETVARIDETPFLNAIEVFGIWIPILFHGIFGMVIVFEAKPNTGPYAYGRNWLYVLQRVTGIVAFAYIVFHFMQFRWRRPEFMVSPYEDVHTAMMNPWVLAFYVVGITACVFHLANGIAGFLFTWGITVGPRSKRAAGLACAGFGVALLAMGLWTLFAFV